MLEKGELRAPQSPERFLARLKSLSKIDVQ
jgi:hypothetical protein